MKKQILPLVGVLGLLLVAGSAFAQVRTVRADIPFDFQIGAQTLPAGPYLISRVGDSSPALMVQNHQTNQAEIMLPHNVQSLTPSKTTKLVFRVYGDRYFLYRIWVEGEELGKELPKSAMETRVAKEQQQSHDVYVAAVLR